MLNWKKLVLKTNRGRAKDDGKSKPMKDACCVFLTSEWVLGMLFAGQNHLFVYTFSVKIKKKKVKACKTVYKYIKKGSTSI